MYIEREKKYLVDENLARKLIEKSVARIGVVQWYLDTCSFDIEKGMTNYRIRYTIDESGNEEWVRAFKSTLIEDFTRHEEESKIEISADMFETLTFKPVVAKIRYYLLYEPAEVVLDEFIELDKPYRVPVKYIAEVETQEPFEEYERMFDLYTPLSLEEFERYINKNFAVESKLSPREIIDIVSEKLKKSKQKQLKHNWSDSQ
ncbi:MAG TPA: hypothetical protein PKI14_14095 [Fervidobacterium sp.]|nr:hypothetical protein [Fervidobacterium sp.]HPT54948.1 hypothetical protein [Fervidobacterium sp.]HPZ18538.1 hypothetical protein [Fervidobacterium sp.]HQE50084.1 hypothetical protein [Fervidobacterium sp.]HUM44070.1 hypothetical protein [Fervidobacterium sp.]